MKLHQHNGGSHIDTERGGLGDFQLIRPDVAFAVVVVLSFIAAVLFRLGFL